MIHVTLSLPDDLGAALEARMKDGGYADLAEYVRAIVETHVDFDDDWEMTPELAAALEEGERSGISDRSIDEIFAEARARYGAG